MRLAAFAWALALCGCSHKSAYNCESSTQCEQAGAQGICEPEGYCAFPDPACPSGERFEPNAGGGLGGQCVTDVPPTDATDAPGIFDAAPDAKPVNCGAVGMQCCPGANACVGNAFCSAGMCKQCITDLALGGDFSCALKYDGTVWCSGGNVDGELGDGVLGGGSVATRMQVRDTSMLITDATAVTAAEDTACVLRAGGTAWCWGKNDDGQLGNGTTNAAGLANAVEVTRASDSMPLPNLVQIGGGHDTMCAPDTGGTLWCWGDNGEGQLGDGTTTSRSRASPVLVAPAGAAFTGAVQVTGNQDGHICARTSANAISCWGGNTTGSVGDNTTVNKLNPVQVFTGTFVAAGRFHTCAVGANNTVSCWGSSRGMRLSSLVGGNKLVPTLVVASGGGAAFSGAVEVAAGGISCARMQNGDVDCWGGNAHGQTGSGTAAQYPTPVTFGDGTPLHDAVRVIANYSRACAFLADGELLCWGKNTDGALGDGTFTNRNYPGPVPMTCP